MTKPISRRSFLASSLAVTASSGVPFKSFAFDGIRRRAIPGTDETLPVVGLGAPGFFYKTPPEGDEPAKAVIRAMVEAGGTVIDTPPFFRPDPPVVGRILQELGLVDDLFLTGKITVAGKEAGIRHLETSLANLGKDPIDLLMVHNMRDMENHWPTLCEWKEAGRTRYIGVSLTRQTAYNKQTDYSAMEKFMAAEKPDFVMPGYSISRTVAADRILPAASDNGIAVIVAEPFKAIEDGSFFNVVAGTQLPEWAAEFDCESWAQFALKYIISNPAVTCVLAETSKVKHIVDNMGAGYGRLPDPAMREKMRAYVMSL